MKKVLFEISGEERNRILEMHQTATSKQYLTEDIGDDEKMLALEIVILIDTITKREDFDFEKLQGENREMFIELGLLQRDIVTKALPKYRMANSSETWKVLMDILRKKSNVTPNKSSEQLFELIDELVALIESYFPNETMKDIEKKLINFNDELNKL